MKKRKSGISNAKIYEKNVQPFEVYHSKKKRKRKR